MDAAVEEGTLLMQFIKVIYHGEGEKCREDLSMNPEFFLDNTDEPKNISHRWTKLVTMFERSSSDRS